jgi:hypothetical protein
MNSDKSRDVIRQAGNRTTTYLGTRTSILGTEEHITLRDTDRLTHVLTVGPTGQGKSQTLLHVALQDAYKDRGLCILNPKGDLIDEFIAKLPEKRWDDVIYINPARETVPSINVLKPYTTGQMTLAQKENQKEIIVADLIDLFRRHSEHWGDQFGRVLETLLHAYLDLNIRTEETYTLVDVYRSVINQDVLADLIDQTANTIVREQLVRIKEEMTTYDLEPLQRRLNDFMMNAAIRRVIAAEAGIDFQEALDDQQIILVDIQKGEVGQTVSELVGSLVLTKVWAAAQSRVTQTPAERTPFSLFVDELQTFAGEGSNVAKILSEAREYRLGCWFATQYLHQLEPELRRAVTNNTTTKIVFNPSDSEELGRLAGMVQGIDKKALTHLGRFRAAVQTPGERTQRGATTIDTYPPWDADRSHVEHIKQSQTVAEPTERSRIQPSLGPGQNSGGDTHRVLLTTAKEHLEDRGFQVNLLYQEGGSEKPDGHVHLPTEELAHLEAETGTLSKPVKVLRNYLRGIRAGREVFFVVATGEAAKLQTILEDPKNRHGTRHQDEQGTFEYYVDEDGDPFTELDKLALGEYRILEVGEDDLTIHDPGDAPTRAETATLDDQLREKDRLVLTCIHDGRDDIQQINTTTVLANHEAAYCFEKLAELDLIDVETPEGMVERVVDGQKRVFDAPKQARLTDRGKQYFR